MKKIIVAIDGPAASGKSTTAKLLAKKLGYIYLDTGAMYRACALAAKRKGIDIKDHRAVASLMEDIDIRIEQGLSENIIWLDNQDVSSEIRTPEISASASAISAQKEVRDKMVALQRRMGINGGVVLDGRDIGTVVFPRAEAKFFMIAAAEERAKRRHLELLSKGIDTPFEQVLAEIKARDLADSNREIAPLKPADDAIETDTSNLSIDEQVDVLFVKVQNLLNQLDNTDCDTKKTPLVRLAAYSGYCFGVRRALQMAMEAKNNAKPVFTLGEIIHNPSIVQLLETEGIKVAKHIAELKNSVVIVRSHGISKQEFDLLKANNNEIIDATCPYVKRTHEIMQKMTAEGYQVLILGDKEHPEVIGMLSYGNKDTYVVSATEPAPKLNVKRLCLISQTTQKLKNLEGLACKLLPDLTELRVFNTICLATTQRQEASVQLAKASDLMIVVGGYNSANTRALASLSSEVCKTVHIENETELDKLDLSYIERIGLAAGASTPEEMILKVYNRILIKSGSSCLAHSLAEIPMFKEESC